MATARVFIRVRLYLALVWLRFCNWIVRLLRVQSLKPVGQFFHKVVIIGDDFAAGLGDYVTMGKKTGLAQYLESAVARSDKVRHKWEIINAGIPGSASSDWLLSSSKSYFNTVFSNKQTGDAEIVIVILGSSELRNDPSGKAREVSKNLASICDTLRKKGKQVCVATMASPDPLQQEAVVLPVNSMLEEYCTSTKGEDFPIVLGPRLDTFAFRRETALAFDGFHLNSKSYKLLARNAADFLVPMMTSIEWKTWKNELHKVEYDKALYD